MSVTSPRGWALGAMFSAAVLGLSSCRERVSPGSQRAQAGEGPTPPGCVFDGRAYAAGERINECCMCSGDAVFACAPDCGFPSDR